MATVAELIAHLQTLPQDAKVYVRERGGCSECDPLGGDWYQELYSASDVTFREEFPADGYRRPYKAGVII